MLLLLLLLVLVLILVLVLALVLLLLLLLLLLPLLLLRRRLLRHDPHFLVPRFQALPQRLLLSQKILSLMPGSLQGFLESI